MELRVNKEKRELKSHGTYEFPVNISRKRLSSYETGSFPWHWHDEIELTLILSGEIDYRVNDNSYRRAKGCSATPMLSMPAAGWRIRTAITFPLPFIPVCWAATKAASSDGNLWTPL